MRGLLLALCCSTIASYHAPLVSTMPLRSRPTRCVDEDSRPRKLSAVELIGYGAILGQLTPALLVGLTRLGLIRPPPLNAFTSIANNAMDDAVKNGEINKVSVTHASWLD